MKTPKRGWLWGLVLGLMTVIGQGAEPATDAPTLQRVPRTDDEFRVAFERAEARSARLVGADLPLSPPLDEDADGDMPQRVSVLAVGMNMTPADQQQLPYLTGSLIYDRVSRYFLCVQAEVARDARGVPYLEPRPWIAVCAYADAARSCGSTELVDASIRDVRSLGLFVKPGQTATPDQLRTLVLVNKNTLAVEDPQTKTQTLRPNYELILVRAQVASDGTLAFHTFLTSQQRTRLHYAPPFQHPSSSKECCLTGTMCFTNYSLIGLLPTEKAMRRATFQAQAEYPLDVLHRFVAQEGWGDNAWDHLTDVLDSIVHGVALSAKAKAGS